MKKYVTLLFATGASISLLAQKPATTGTVAAPATAQTVPSGSKAFIPGDSVLYFDNFESEKIETSPSRWRYTFPAVIVSYGGQKWIRLKNQGEYQPKLKSPRSSRYTYEFDMLIDGSPNEHNHVGTLIMTLGEKAEMDAPGENMMEETYDYAQVIDEIMFNEPSNLYISNANASVSGFAQDETLAKKIGKKVHVAIAIDGSRYTLWFDDKKIADEPKLVYSDKFDLFKLAIDAFNEKDPKHRVLLTNFRFALGPLNMAERLTKTGIFTTSAIRFENGTAKITPESAGTVKEIARVLTENKNLKVKLTGHLDASDVNNPMQLSKQQAEAVRAMLIADFGIAPARLETEGKGNIEPVAKGKSQEAKANNRRIQITKL